MGAYFKSTFMRKFMYARCCNYFFNGNIALSSRSLDGLYLYDDKTDSYSKIFKLKANDFKNYIS